MRFKRTDPDGIIHRTARGQRFLEYLDALNDVRTGRDKAALDRWNAANAEVAAIRSTPGQVHVSAVMTNLSVMFANDEFIGDMLMPTYTNDGKQAGTYFTYPKREMLAYPDDDMSARGDPPELNQSRQTSSYSLTPRGMSEKVDQLTIQNQDAPLNELLDAELNVLNAMAFNRELRQAAILTTGSSYSGNTTAIAAADRFDSSGGGDPGGVMDDAIKSLWMGRGPGKLVAFCSLDVHNVLKRHPAILDGLKYSGNAKNGMATRQQIADFFEVDEYLVGRARKDTANIGQTASYSRIWSDVLGVVRVMQTPSIRNAAFGLTIQDMDRQSETFWEPSEGNRGCYKVKAYHSDQEKVIAPECGYLVTTPIG